MACHGALGKVWHNRYRMRWLHQTMNHSKNQSKTDCFFQTIHNKPQSITVTSDTNCPVALVPAPPAVTVSAPPDVTVPARVPAVPAV